MEEKTEEESLKHPREQSDEAPEERPVKKTKVFPSFNGKVVESGAEGYDKATYQYATSSKFTYLNPAIVLYAKRDESHTDIIKAIKYSKENQLAISVRSGGHQYLGFSSTNGQNIQIDMIDYDEFDTSNYERENGSTIIIGPALRLDRIGQECEKLGIFFPHGECSHVAVGGHCQTGGFSIFSNSFGLFIDRIEWFDLITAADEKVRTVKKPDPSNPNKDNDDLWFSVLGGSPGNFGIVTRLQVNVFHDEDYKLSKGLFHYLPFKKETLKDFLELAEEFNDDAEMSADYNYTLMAISAGQIHKYELDSQMNLKYPELFGPDGLLKLFGQGLLPSAVIVMFAFTGVEEKNLDNANTWFEKVDGLIEKSKRKMNLKERLLFGVVNKVLGVPFEEHAPMTTLMHKCVWFFAREFNLPFQKRIFQGDALNLKERGFAEWATEKSWEIESQRKTSGVHLGCQWNPGAGKGSLQEPNSHFPTAIGGRKGWASLCAFDFFYETRKKDGSRWDEPLEFGAKWLDTASGSITNTATGENGKFCDRDKRYMYAPWGPPDAPWDSSKVVLDESWHHYFDDEKTYERVLDTKLRFDPEHVFSPNPFCVGFTKMPSELQKLRTFDHQMTVEDTDVVMYGANDHGIHNDSKVKLDSSVLHEDYLNDLIKQLKKEKELEEKQPGGNLNGG